MNIIRIILSLLMLNILFLTSCQKEPTACFTIEVASQGFIGGGVHDNRLFQNCTTEGYSYSWDFGDGSTTSSLTSPTHEYTRVGNFIVTLTATSENGRKESTSTETVIVRGRAYFVCSGSYPVTVQVGSEVQQGFPTTYYNDCSSTIRFSLPAGTYTYTASEQSPGTQIWNGSFTISGDGCAQVNL